MASQKQDEELVGTSPLGTFTSKDGAPRFELHVYLGPSVTTHVLPFAGSVTIGRSRGADISIDDASISRKHALLHVGSTLLVQDLGSQNGTRVGASVLAPHTNAPIAAGVPFVVGGVSVVVQPIGGVSPTTGSPAPAPAPASTSAPRSLRDEVAALERARITEALAACGGNQTKAAAMLGIPRRTLVLRLSEYGIPRPRK